MWKCSAWFSRASLQQRSVAACKSKLRHSSLKLFIDMAALSHSPTHPKPRPHPLNRRDCLHRDLPGCHIHPAGRSSRGWERCRSCSSRHSWRSAAAEARVLLQVEAIHMSCDICTFRAYLLKIAILSTLPYLIANSAITSDWWSMHCTIARFILIWHFTRNQLKISLGTWSSTD